MNAQEWASLLNGREYGNELTDEEAERAGMEDIVIIYGASDDLMEIRGVCDDEIGCFDGGFAYFSDEKLLQNICDNPECPHFLQMKKHAKTVEAVWDNGEYSWTYKTDIPHATFDIMEDGEKYCRGIVFALRDV